MIQKLSNISAAIIGYFSATSVMLSINNIGISQGVLDESVKAIVGLLIAIVSRIVFGKIEARNKSRKARKYAHIKPETQPETITLNSIIKDEKEISK